MAQASIRARIAADASEFHQALTSTEEAARAWGVRMATINQRATTFAPGGGPGGRGGAGGMAILELSRGIEDLQYGIRGVLNNIPSLIMQLGGSAGLAGAASLAAVAAYQLGQKIRAMWEAEKIAAEQEREFAIEIGKTTDAMREQEAQAAKKGSPEAAERLQASIKTANQEASQSNKILATNQQLAKESADATTALAKARVMASDAAESSKAQDIMEIERAALVQMQAEEERRLDRSLEILETRRNAAKKFAEEEAHRAAEAAQFLADVPAENVAGVMSARNAAISAAVDAAKAQKAFRELDREMTVEQAALVERLRQKEKTDIDLTTALELAGRAKVKKALEEEQQKRLEIIEADEKWREGIEKKILAERTATLKGLEDHEKALGTRRVTELREQRRHVQADREERRQQVTERARQISGAIPGLTPDQAKAAAEEELGPRHPGRINARSRRRAAASTEQVLESSKGGDVASILKAIDTKMAKLVGNSASQRDTKGDPVPRE